MCVWCGTTCSSAVCVGVFLYGVWGDLSVVRKVHYCEANGSGVMEYYKCRNVRDILSSNQL